MDTGVTLPEVAVVSHSDDLVYKQTGVQCSKVWIEKIFAMIVFCLGRWGIRMLYVPRLCPGVPVNCVVVWVCMYVPCVYV